MRVNKQIIRQHAQVFFEIGLEGKILDLLILDLETVNRKLRSDKNLREALINPSIEFSDKKNFLKNIFSDFISHCTYNLVFILIKKDNLNSLEPIIFRLKKLMKEKYETLEASVISAIPLSPDTKTQISDKLSVLTSKKIVLETKVDPEILGGLIFKVEDELIDLSLGEKLKKMREEISKI
jgi:F-type H+-transporting ATPase subunit delta